jgi:hypothetical protein
MVTPIVITSGNGKTATAGGTPTVNSKSKSSNNRKFVPEMKKF